MDQNWLYSPAAGPSGARAPGKTSVRAESLLWPAAGATVIILACVVSLLFSASPSLVLLLGLSVMAYVNYFAGARDVLYPAFMFTSIWALVVFAYNVCPIPVDRLGMKTVVVLLVGGASFSIGSYIGNRPLIRTNHAGPGTRSAPWYRDNPQARNLLLALTLLDTAAFLVIIVRIAGGISGLGISFLLKLNAPGGPLDNPGTFAGVIVASGGFLTVLTLWVMIMEEKRRWKVVVCALCACIFPLFVTQRGLVMVALCGCITLFLLKRRDRSFRRMAAPLGFAALGMICLMSLMSLTKYWVQSGQFSATGGAMMYITGPLAAFNYYLHHEDEYRDQPAAVFTQVLTPLSHTGLIRYQTPMEVDGSKLDRFVDVPFPANVYTAYKPYYADFGPLGCFLAFAFFGFIEGAIFYLAIRGNPFAILFLVHLSSCLMFVTFDDMYHGFSRHLNVLIFAIVYFCFMKRWTLRV